MRLFLRFRSLEAKIYYMKRGKKLATGLIIMFGLAFGWHTLTKNEPVEQPDPQKTSQERQQLFDKKQLSIDDPSSIWLVVNKRRPLKPADYKPADLTAPKIPLRLDAKSDEMQMRQDVAKALEELVRGAKKDANLELMLSSAYRSYNTQKTLYEEYIRLQGQATADQQSARAGHSEHQTGLAADIEPVSRKCEVEACFGDLPEGKWVAANAYQYGFVVRYPKGKEHITGYTYEPWHLRYVGKDLARAIHDAGNPTLEEFFDLQPAPDYQ